MSLKIGIVGLPNVGKSTLFRALTRKQVAIENYPFVTIEPNVGVVEVPDERVEELARLSRSKKIIHAVVEFVDIAGLVEGAAEGQGLGNQFLAHIREADAIAEAVRVFEDPNVVHVAGAVDPARDLAVIDLELILKDLETVTKRLETAAKQVQSGEKTATAQKAALERLKRGLEAGKRAAEIIAPAGATPIRDTPLRDTSLIRSNGRTRSTAVEARPAGRAPPGDQERPAAHAHAGRDGIAPLLRELSLLTAKPRITVFNASETQLQEGWQPSPELRAEVTRDPWVALSAKVEDELHALPPEERREYLASLGLAESGLDQLIRAGYRALGLITFFTTSEDETRAWTIPDGSTAPRAGRAVHSDFEEKFIRAEVIPWKKLVEVGSWARARELGWIRIEGKEYAVKDGDVVFFRI